MLNDASLLSRLRSSRTLILAAAAFSLIAGIGAVTSYVGDSHEATDSGFSVSESGPDGEMLARLSDYARSVEADDPASAAGAGEQLPDDGPSVEQITKSAAMPPHEHDAAIRSMVDGLADRLESSPRDVEGWTLLMRSRVVLGEREAAATAFRKAIEAFKDDSAALREITAAALDLGLKAATEGP
jgi:cytochrome c-type biogenesis protein CcmH